MSLCFSSPSPTPSLPPCSFSCRIVSIESYTAAPTKDLDIGYSDFRSSPIEKVPVIRIFGATPVGQKACVHVHGAFPYLYVPCVCADPSDEYLQLLARSIDHALQVSLGSGSRDVQHVYKIVLTKGKPFYGFHDKVALFLKIYLYNPGMIKRLADLLVAGVVMNQALQPHESHIPFVLQFMMDHHLFGMNHIHLSAVKFRIAGSDEVTASRATTPMSPLSPHSSPLSLTSSLLYNPSQAYWDVTTLPKEMIVCVPRVSVSELEVDARAADILNRHELSLVSEGFPGLAALWEEERVRRHTLGIVDSPLTPPPSPERSTQLCYGGESRLQDQLEEVLEERLQPSSGNIVSESSSDVPSQPPPGPTGPSPSTGGPSMEVVVDTDMLQHTMNLSQKCSAEAIEKCTDDDLVELMKELCQTQDLRLSQSFSQQSQPPPSQPHTSQLQPHTSQPPPSQLQPPQSLTLPPSSQLQPASSSKPAPIQSQASLPPPSQPPSATSDVPSSQPGVPSSQPLPLPLSTSRSLPLPLSTSRSLPLPLSTSQTIGEVLLKQLNSRRSHSVQSSTSLFSSPSPQGNGNRLSARPAESLSRARLPVPPPSQPSQLPPASQPSQPSPSSQPSQPSQASPPSHPPLPTPDTSPPLITSQASRVVEGGKKEEEEEAVSKHLSPVYTRAYDIQQQQSSLNDSIASVATSGSASNDTNHSTLLAGNEEDIDMVLAVREREEREEREGEEGAGSREDKYKSSLSPNILGDISEQLSDLDQLDPNLKLASPLMRTSHSILLRDVEEELWNFDDAEDIDPDLPRVDSSLARASTPADRGAALALGLSVASKPSAPDGGYLKAEGVDMLGDDYVCLTESQLPIPCAQPSPDLTKPTLAGDISTARQEDKEGEGEEEEGGWADLDRVALERLDPKVQLEYDIHEANTSRFEGSDVSMDDILCVSPLPRVESETREVAGVPSQARKQLLRLVLESASDSEGSGGETAQGEWPDSCEEEHVEMSQPVWDDGGVGGEVCEVSALRGAQRRPGAGELSRTRGGGGGGWKNISQLDGSNTPPPSSPLPKPSSDGSGAAHPQSKPSEDSNIPPHFKPVSGGGDVPPSLPPHSNSSDPPPSAPADIPSSVSGNRKRRKSGKTLGLRKKRRKVTIEVPASHKAAAPLTTPSVTSHTPVVADHTYSTVSEHVPAASVAGQASTPVVSKATSHTSLIADSTCEARLTPTPVVPTATSHTPLEADHTTVDERNVHEARAALTVGGHTATSHTSSMTDHTYATISHTPKTRRRRGRLSLKKKKQQQSKPLTRDQQHTPGGKVGVAAEKLAALKQHALSGSLEVRLSRLNPSSVRLSVSRLVSSVSPPVASGSGHVSSASAPVASASLPVSSSSTTSSSLPLKTKRALRIRRKGRRSSTPPATNSQPTSKKPQSKSKKLQPTSKKPRSTSKKPQSVSKDPQTSRNPQATSRDRRTRRLRSPDYYVEVTGLKHAHLSDEARLEKALRASVESTRENPLPHPPTPPRATSSPVRTTTDDLTHTGHAHSTDSTPPLPSVQDLDVSITSIEESPPMTTPLKAPGRKSTPRTTPLKKPSTRDRARAVHARSETPPLDPVATPIAPRPLATMLKDLLSANESGVDSAPSDAEMAETSAPSDLETGSAPSDLEIAETSFRLHFTSESESEGELVQPGECSASLDLSGVTKLSEMVRLGGGPVAQEVEAGLAEPEAGSTSQEMNSRGRQEPSVRAGQVWTPRVTPLPASTLVESAPKYGLPSAVHTKPFCSNPADVQPAKIVGGRVLRVASKMPYELKEFEPPCVHANSASLKDIGLLHTRATLSAYLGDHISPPLCHPLPGPGGTSKSYSLEDYKQDMDICSRFLSHKRVVLTPALPPPTPGKLAGKSGREISLSNVKEEFSHGNIKSESTLDGAEKIAGTSPEADISIAPTPSSVPTTPTSVRATPTPAGTTPTSIPVGVAHSTPKAHESRERLVTPVSHKPRPTLSRGEDSLLLSSSLLKRETSQLEGPTPVNPYGFKISQSALRGAQDSHDVQYLTCLSLELHTHTRGNLRPDPEFDPILAVCYYVHHDWPRADGAAGPNSQLGVIAIDIDNCGFTSFVGKTALATPTKGNSATPLKGTGATPKKKDATPTKVPPADDGASASTARAATPPKVAAGGVNKQDLAGYLCRCGLSADVKVEYVTSEHALLQALVGVVRRTDPDFLIGYEVVMSSWGYLIDRAAVIDVNLVNEISRMPIPPDSRPQNRPPPVSAPTRKKPFDLRVPGRIVLNVWQFMRREVALNIYTLENVCFHVLHKRLPHFSHKTLTTWYQHQTTSYRYKVVEYYLERCYCNFSLLDKFGVVHRTSEFARLYGIEFENVANRGSQYKVEAMMLRLAKPANYIAVSPSIQQRARMAAPECIPLVMEPESKFYHDPVLVLDFQSLYPSIVIAYNYCFSTCLGRFRNLSLDGSFKFGTSSLDIPYHILKKLKGHIHVSPNGVAFVRKDIRKGILPTMLEEILNTRIMVKNSMKKHKADKLLQRLLDARQLGLKLVANTTFGYTAASYSGRMPCIEIADSIVQKGRETLERAMQLVERTREWGGRVVYGDTDSLFVLLKGKSKDEAFRIGREICDRVTADNPKPVKLKFEKVYLPCVLEAKKRYVGYGYESPDQKEPIFDAKGIETVRRDSCPAVGKVLERSLRLLFQSRDVSLVKSYVQRQFWKLLDGKVNIQDFTFAKEYRGREYYRPGASVPALELTKSSLQSDRRSEPRAGERVPYVIVYGAPGLPLIKLVRRPQEVMEQPGLRLNATYYITKQLLPTLDRVFSLMGVDVREWYHEMPKVVRAPAHISDPSKQARGTIAQYFATQHCPACQQLTVDGICSKCRADPQKMAVTLTMRKRRAEKTDADINTICCNCIGSPDVALALQCDSLDCPVLYRRFRAQQDLAHGNTVQLLLDKALTPPAAS